MAFLKAVDFERRFFVLCVSLWFDFLLTVDFFFTMIIKFSILISFTEGNQRVMQRLQFKSWFHIHYFPCRNWCHLQNSESVTRDGSSSNSAQIGWDESSEQSLLQGRRAWWGRELRVPECHVIPAAWSPFAGFISYSSAGQLSHTQSLTPRNNVTHQ